MLIGATYWHPFTRSFRGSGCVFAIKRILRYLVIQTQVLLGIRRNTTIPFHKGGQWVSITRELIDYLLEQEDRAFTIFSRTFGADEYFVPTLIWDTPFMERLFDATDESRGAMRYIGWRADGQLSISLPKISLRFSRRSISLLANLIRVIRYFSKRF